MTGALRLAQEKYGCERQELCGWVWVWMWCLACERARVYDLEPPPLSLSGDTKRSEKRRPV